MARGVSQASDGEHPPRPDQPAPAGRQDRALMRLGRHGLWPPRQPQPVTAPRPQMGGRGPWPATAPQGVPIDGQGGRLAWSRRQGAEDAFRPRAAGGFSHMAVPFAHDVVQGRRTGRPMTGNAQGPCQPLAITAAPVGQGAVTPVAAQHGHAHQRQNSRQGMAPALGLAWGRTFMEACHEGTDGGFHELTA
jgi:hypothetical protein